MADFLKGQLDYIYFCYGLAFIILTAVCVSLHRNERERFPWAVLGFFGIIHGLHEWLEIVELTVGDAPTFLAVRVLVATVSFLFLAEFGRAGVARIRGGGPGRAILLLPLAVTVAGGLAGGWPAMNVALRYSLGLIGGLGAALALYRYAVTRDAKSRRHLAAAAVFMGLYGLAAGLIVPPLAFFPARVLNAEVFFRLTGLPIQLMRALLAAGIFISIFNYSRLALLVPGERERANANIGYLHWAFTLIITLVLIGGWSLTHYLGSGARREVVREANRHAAEAAQHILQTVKESTGAAEAMAGSPWVIAALLSGKPADLSRANNVLDRYRDAHEVSVCYLLNRVGTAVASSNRNAPDSFVGRSYPFRAYFRMAVQGVRGFQFACGATSGERGHYASHPVLGPDRKVIGVAVVKLNLDRTERDFPLRPHLFFVSPEGIIFLANSPELRLKALWPLPADILKRVIAERSFGPGPFPSLLALEAFDKEDIRYHGRQYLVSRHFLDIPGWSVAALNPTGMIPSTDPLQSSSPLPSAC
ncbi:MAG: hypothetical protein Q8K46_05875 [Deltaproteobacteria bacterium]|nr:hypothetical protein [Deltaproteobacteria bacterium]